MKQKLTVWSASTPGRYSEEQAWRSAGPKVNQGRVDNQPQDCQGTWDHRTPRAKRPSRRTDRVRPVTASRLCNYRVKERLTPRPGTASRTCLVANRIASRVRKFRYAWHIRR